MKRRDMLVGAGAVALSGCAAETGCDTAASGAETFEWKMVTTWPPNFPGMGTGVARLVEQIAFLVREKKLPDIRDLRDEADRITRYLEDLDLARERTMVLREEFLGQLAQEQNSRMYVLSVVAAVFLPLTFVTGLLGMNVGGLPGLDSPRGFLGSVVLMVFAAAALVGFFRWKRWF